jgi:CheY-like chemotaxis protein
MVIAEAATAPGPRLEEARYNLQRAASGRRRARVLVVDPSPAFISRAREQLREQGFRVHVARSCKEAAARIDADTSFAVINLLLSDGSGYELSKRLTEANPRLECFFVTSEPADRLPSNLREVKPIVRKASGLWPLRVALAKALYRDESASSTALAAE